MRLEGRLPAIRGRIEYDAPLAPYSWFRVGGPADALVQPADEADLAAFLAGCPDDVPVTVLGVGSNVIIRDGGVEGAVIRLAPRGFGGVEALPGHRIRAGAAALDAAVARKAADAGVAGLEFYRGVPGTIGGALRMNAGCYGAETRDVLLEATAYDRAGRRHTLTNADFGFRYRHSAVAPDLIFASAVFQGQPDEPDAIRARMDAITARREASQPIREKTGGSTFKNPDPALSGGRSAWQCVDAAGLRAHARGGARMSELHANFMINAGAATAADLEGLGEEVIALVRERLGVTLEWEIKRIGRAA